MVIKNVNLETVIGIKSGVPKNELPEFAFAGRSNVGKSSLINAMLNRKALAKVSAKPGKTQTINYYNVNAELFLVDLPGYGYTEAALQVRAEWGKMVERYLKSSETLKHVFLLIDIRHEPSKDDKLMYEWILSQGFTPVIVATKLDKIKRSQYGKQISIIKKALDFKEGQILIPFSSETKAGVEELWELIEGLY